MEQPPKTSFIPKQSLGVAQGRPARRKSFNILTFFALVIFLAVLALSIGTFFYRQYSEAELEKQKVILEELRKGLGAEGDIATIRKLEYRFQIAKTLLDQHLSISRVFDALEVRVQEFAQITSFDLARKESGNAELILTGLAKSFNTTALQERGFAAERTFKEGSVIFSGINLQTPEEGEDADTAQSTVTFSVTADLDIEQVKYVAPEATTTEAVLSTESNSTTTSSATETGAVEVTTTP